jgi:hypothetical protein
MQSSKALTRRMRSNSNVSLTCWLTLDCIFAGHSPKHELLGACNLQASNIIENNSPAGARTTRAQNRGPNSPANPGKVSAAQQPVQAVVPQFSEYSDSYTQSDRDLMDAMFTSKSEGAID